MNEFEIFNQTDKDIPELETVREVLTHAVLKEKLENVIFNVIIVDNDYIHELNKNYRNIDRETDVITFKRYSKRLVVLQELARKYPDEYEETLIKHYTNLAIKIVNSYINMVKMQENDLGVSLI